MGSVVHHPSLDCFLFRQVCMFVCLLDTSRSGGQKEKCVRGGVCLLTTRLLIDLLALGKEGTAPPCLSAKTRYASLS